MSSPVVLGLDFGGTKVAAAVASLGGRRLGEVTIATEPSRGARWNLDRGLDAARRLVRDVAPGRQLAAVGASTFGIPAADGVRLAPAIPGWEEFSLGRELASAFECDTIRLATDVKAAAAAEARSGALVGHEPGLYVNLGTGLAAAIVSGGSVVSGANGAAGEIGYNLLRRGDVGRRDHPVLEDLVSGIGLSATANRRAGARLTAEDVFQRAATSPRLSALVDEFVEELGFHLVNLAVAVDPSRIAVGGGIVRSWDRLERPLRRALDAGVPFPPELVVGAFPFDAALVGALALALDAAGPVDQDDEPKRHEWRLQPDRAPEPINSSTVAERPGRHRS
jgi:predicted NBD/HSP70 family sugar kinase